MEDDPLFRDRSVWRSRSWRLSYDAADVVSDPIFGAVYSEFEETRSAFTGEILDRVGTGHRAELIDRVWPPADDWWIPIDPDELLVWHDHSKCFLRLREIK